MRAAGVPCIALLTDYGLKDHFVGVIKGVIATICPTARVVDICHEIEPQNIKQAALLLEISRGFFPPGTVFLGVVDPGVGTKRRPVAVHALGAWFIGPDNGLFSWVWQARLGEPEDRIIVLRNRRYWLDRVSTTFHGRDIFAPVAAHLSAGADPTTLGPPGRRLVTLPRLRPDSLPRGAQRLHVLHVDRFGNLITDLATASVTYDRQHLTFQVGDYFATGLRESYVSNDILVAVSGSTGYVELARPGGSASSLTGLRMGDSVIMRPRSRGSRGPLQ